MQPEERRNSLVREWLSIAEEDLHSARRLLEREPLIRAATYHSQQAMEKALKGYLTWHQISFPWTHNLERLVQMCEQVDTEFEQLLSTAEYLSPFATVPRYPADHVLITLEEANEAFRLASSALEFVRARLPDDVQSETGCAMIQQSRGTTLGRNRIAVTNRWMSR
jgi:HEPN domain-containing protein